MLTVTLLSIAVVMSNGNIHKIEVQKNELLNYCIAAIKEMIKDELCSFNLNLIEKTERQNLNRMNDLKDELLSTLHGKYPVTIKNINIYQPRIHNTYSVILVDDIEKV